MISPDSSRPNSSSLPCSLNWQNQLKLSEILLQKHFISITLYIGLLSNIVLGAIVLMYRQIGIFDSNEMLLRPKGSCHDICMAIIYRIAFDLACQIQKVCCSSLRLQIEIEIVGREAYNIRMITLSKDKRI